MNTSASHRPGDIVIRVIACVIVAVTLVFVFNNYLTFWMGWPGTLTFLQHKQWLGFGPLDRALEGVEVTLGWLQFLSFAGSMGYTIAYVLLTPNRPLRTDAEYLSLISAFIIRVAFWLTFLIGLIETIVALPPVGEWVELVASSGYAREPGWSVRVMYIRFLVLTASLLIAWYVRFTGFAWLALLIILVEFEIIVLRQVYSYDMAPMEVLVRSWYAALLLLAAAYFLVHGGRAGTGTVNAPVDGGGKAWANITVALAFGLPMCMTVLWAGMWRQDSSINSSLLGFEFTPGNFSGSVEFLTAGFTVVLALSMTIQLMSYFLYNAASLRGEFSIEGERSSGDAAP